MNITTKVTTKANTGLKPLSLKERAKLERFWNKRLTDPLAFVPKEEKQKGLITATEARIGNILFGKFADKYMKEVVLKRLTGRADRERRLKCAKEVFIVGHGLGYGTHWLPKATKVGFRVHSVDVSGAAWIWATTNLGNQFHTIQPMPTPQQEPRVQTFEIQSLLAEPEKAEVDLTTVEMWYLCRLLNCLSTKSAKIVLQEIGRVTLSPSHNTSNRGAVVIINALSDDNPSVDTCCVATSIRRSRRMILANLARGAGCPVEARFVEHYDNYFGKLVTAMTVMAKR